jgi:hypothetical protein
MRQIHICAWLLMTCSALAACGGEEFSSNDKPVVGEVAPHDKTPTGSPGQADHEEAPPRSTGGRASSGSSGASNSGGSGTSGASGGFSAPAPGGAGEGGSTAALLDPECPSGEIRFRMLPGRGLAADYLCDAGCGSGWLTITDAEGATAFSISSACGIASCESCDALPCAAAACLPKPLTAEGSELVWTGTYLAKDTCGQNMACQRQACVPPGKYKARACAAVSGGVSANAPGGCLPQDTQVCAEVELDFPAERTIDLVLEAPR